jgi:hypothetical protein
MLDDAREGKPTTFPPRNNTPVDGIIEALKRQANAARLHRAMSGTLTPRDNQLL